MLNVQNVNIDLLKFRGDGVRTHSKAPLDQIENSIKAFGYTIPLVIDEEMNVIGGNAVLSVLKGMRYKTVPVVVRTGLSEGKKKALALALNKILNSGIFVVDETFRHHLMRIVSLSCLHCERKLPGTCGSQHNLDERQGWIV